jgi:lysophospholipase L1-like esterase
MDSLASFAKGPSRTSEPQLPSKNLIEIRLRILCPSEGSPLALPSVRERAHQVNQPLYYHATLDTHPDPDGYRVIAELVAQFLLEKELIPLTTDHGPDDH